MESAQDICGMTKGPRRHGGGMRRLMKQLGKKCICVCAGVLLNAGAKIQISVEVNARHLSRSLHDLVNCTAKEGCRM